MISGNIQPVFLNTANTAGVALVLFNIPCRTAAGTFKSDSLPVILALPGEYGYLLLAAILALLVILVVSNIRKRKSLKQLTDAEEALQTKERLLERQKDEIQKLSNRLIELQESDRESIARELHDTVAQKLGLAKIRLEKAILDSAGQDAEFLKEASSTVSEAIDELRSISADLRPHMLDDLGLASTIKWHLENQYKEIGSSLRVIGNEPHIHSSKQVNIFRIFQEIMLNIQKHSKANNVEVRIEFLPGKMALSVTDDGKGFNLRQVRSDWPASPRFGLLHISERVELMGGQLDIDTKEGKGTSIRVSVPIED